MKRIMLSLAVLGTFLIYSLGIRHQLPKLNFPTSSATSNSLSSGTTSNNTSTGNIANSGTPNSSASYKDGTYTGSVADAYYGNVQVAVTISAGKITDVKFLQYPDSHGTSVAINQQAMPYLRQEAI